MIHKSSLCLFYWITILSIVLADNDIHDLEIIGDYRSIKLKWNFYKNPLEYDFKITCCEMNNWPMLNRCKEQILNVNPDDDVQTIITHHNEPDESVIQLKRITPTHYQASINSLRIQTNYSVSVQSILKNQNLNYQISSDDANPAIKVTTKSFNAKTLRCLANSSVIQVFTGPYFGGRISVEESDNPACFINGDKNDPRESYNFTINHNLCKSKTIDNTRIESMVLVNENREILTHNSRRYLVICGFDPDKYTLTASVAVPPILLKKFAAAAAAERMKGRPSAVPFAFVSKVTTPKKKL